jgi:hypothetical protein
VSSSNRQNSRKETFAQCNERCLSRHALAALITLSVVSPPATAFSDWIGAYAIIDKVVIEPQFRPHPSGFQLWGDFAIASKTDRNTYQAPERGYLYFTIKDGKEEATRKEWADLKSLAATGRWSASDCVIN